MTDDVKALIAEARNPGRALSAQEWALLAQQLAEALEAATVAHAVDREALAKVLFVEQFDGETWDATDAWDGDAMLRLIWDGYAGSVLASGILRDVRDVQAEALEQAARAALSDQIHGAYAFLTDRAQAIREARSE